ncbi:hypothetical protein OIU76_024298 [Salix suchowensis]|nr:hypothetical protein OIU76_024298 [Salix suchowensis]
MAANGNGEVAVNGNGAAAARKQKGTLPSITTSDKHHHEVCHDMSAPTVKAQTIDELHSLQKKKSAPNTPIKGIQGTFAALPEEERQKQQLQSISASLASLTRGSGPKVVKGDPANKSQTNPERFTSTT